MQTKKEQLLLVKQDYEQIMSGIKNGFGHQNVNRLDFEELTGELKKAVLVDKSELPPDVVRLNSFVTIKDEKEKKIIQVTVVMPDQANIKQRKISVLSPIGTALIGYRKGKKISWQVPAGKKTFLILDVNNAIS
jgi:regulator of nucleoside diphosphate kinase